jgi:hemerythrin-like domain-containing protein
MTQDTDLTGLRDCYSRLLDICTSLEEVADGLPGNVPIAPCQMLARTVAEQLVTTHAREGRVLMPRLLASGRAGLQRVAERLRQEHDFDHQAAMEIEEALRDLIWGRSVLSPDAIGYMLRSFFESVRRHVYAEQDLLELLEDIAPTDRVVH